MPVAGIEKTDFDSGITHSDPYCPVVLYHKDCADGFTAAWLLYKYRFSEGRQHAEYYPVEYGQDFPQLNYTDRQIFIVDFSYSEKLLDDLNKLADRLIVIDHHKTAWFLHDKPYGHFNTNKSGAQLTWEWLRNNGFVSPFEKPSWLIDYTADRDLWKWKLYDSKEINALIQANLNPTTTFDDWSHLLMFGPDQAAQEGSAILLYQDKVIKDHIVKSYLVFFEGYDVPCCNCTTLGSEVTGALARTWPFAITWRFENGLYYYSLRSDKNGLDVSELAKGFGGGGHKHAAGFTETYNLLAGRQITK